MTRIPSQEHTVPRSYALPDSLSSMSVPFAIRDALSAIQHPGVAVNYRLHKTALDDSRPFQAFQGSLPSLATQFLGAAYVDVALESSEPIPLEVAQRFFGTLESTLQKH